MSNLCIYHGGCTDGIAAAWSVYTGVDPTAWEFFPGVYQCDPPWDLIDAQRHGQLLVLVDFSYKRPVLEEIIDRTPAKVIVIDHHKTAQADLDQLFAEKRISGVFNMNACGALLAWEWFHGADAPPPLLMKEIDAADRWLPTRNAPLIMALRSWPHAPSDTFSWRQLMQQWSRHMTLDGTEELRQEGAAIHRYYRARVDETKGHARRMQIGRFQDVPVVNAPYYLASDVAGELADDAPDGIAAVWWCTKDGGANFSLRSRGDIDVSELAVSFGGGGHAGAAGFTVSRGKLAQALHANSFVP